MFTVRKTLAGAPKNQILAAQSYLEAETVEKAMQTNMVSSAKFHFHTIEEARRLATILANFFPDPDRVYRGLQELLVNAIEHGNLGIGYETKSLLLSSGRWEEEVARLQQLPENEGKFVEIGITKKPDGVYAVIADQGKGFDPRPFMKIDPARAGNPNGRGIALAVGMSFDSVTYNETGNKVVAFVRRTIY